MKISEIYIRKFGKLKEYRLSLSEGTNVLYGENEAGKTTIFNFILAMLYGLPNSRGKDLSNNARGKYMTWGENRIGGTMTIEHGGVSYVIDRTFGKTRAVDSLELTDLTLGKAVSLPNGKEVGEYLFDLDEKTFRGTCFIGQLAKEDVCNNDNVKTKLSNLSSAGNTEYSFEEIALRLKNASLEIKRASSTGKIHPLEVRRSELEARNRAIENELCRIASIDAENQNLEERLTSLSAQLSETEIALSKAKAYKKAAEYKKALENNKKIEAMQAECQKLEGAITRNGFTAGRAYVGNLDSLMKKRDDARVRCEAEEKTLESEKRTLEALESVKPDTKKTSFLPFAFGMVAVAIVAVILYFVLKNIVVSAAVFGVGIIALVCAYLVVNSKNKSVSHAEAPEISAQKVRVSTLAEQIERLKEEYRLCDEEFRSQYLLFFGQEEIFNAQDNIRSLGLAIDKYTEAKIRYDAIKSGIVPQETLDNMLADIGEVNLSEYSEGASPDELERIKSAIGVEISDVEKMLLVNKERAKGKGKLQTELENNLTQIAEMNEKIKAYEYAKECIDLARQGLDSAQSQLQKQFAPEVIRLVSEILSEISCGKYNKMILNADLQTSIIDKDSGAAHEDAFMSSGTLDQIYLALRFAMINLIFADKECPVICMDDALLNFDPMRMSKATEYIMNTLSKKAQVLFFTCRESEKACFSAANTLDV